MEPKFIILSSSDDWNRYINKFSYLDVYYSQEYVKLFSQQEGGISSEAAYYEDDDTIIFYPYIKRGVDLTDYDYYDIVTAYGYGGPHVEGNGIKLSWFYDLFKEYCVRNNIISETIRFHPLTGNAKYAALVMKVDYIRKTTGVDLTKSYNEIRKGYTKSNVRNIKKAEKYGIELVENNEIDAIDIFIDMYYETMNKKNASKMYYFTKDYFYNQMKQTRIGKSSLLFAKYDNKYIAGVLVLIGNEFAHYHLGASRVDYLHMRPNNLLFDYMVRYAKENNAKVLHLGGGYQEDDGLFKFKSSFSNNNNYEFYLGKKVYDLEAYNYLTSLARKNYIVNKNFFPMYRGLISIKEASEL
jgi:hypothetical protein